MAKEGIGTVRMTLVGEPYYNETSFPDPKWNLPVNLQYSTDSNQNYTAAWDNYFTQKLNMTPDLTTPGKFKLPIDETRNGKLVIKKFEVEILSI